MNKYGPGERLNSARYTLPVIPARRERVGLGTLILIGVNRLLDLAVAAFVIYLVYILIMRQDILVAILTYGIR
ncbi:MAG: hypothetical protein A2W05_09780 [Candidatus Schekmanbacteria bacterium RBG_16_38_10]|uniref:Uncharacterized protein n=1 Tax=Candidatus Schekmanbacteria bacterium RBG_16_38_10 TaxID=1817879 RepID=A0A1F7S0J1_9BACT|nr:MAG: hypothetical protein A2W05_09780 [Candidatus Schekmanbacteria bacterium RBG_16_38_10]